MSEKSNTFIFFGKSGSGKGTQAELLIEKLKEKGNEVIYIETGKRFREFIEKEGNHSSKLTKEALNHGELMPVFLPIWLWTSAFVEEFTGTESLVLDGLARRMTEAPVLDSALRFYDRLPCHIVHIDVSREWAFDRLKSRGRADDTDEYINSRLDWFEKDVEPVIEYFEERKGFSLHTINGEQSIEDVHVELIKKLNL
ncbi:AAA family ATPase [Candidatus Parcubacteria bacterium]|nr:AAA family ATPase [Candidatus Parcubacteria bacterium]